MKALAGWFLAGAVVMINDSNRSTTMVQAFVVPSRLPIATRHSTTLPFPSLLTESTRAIATTPALSASSSSLNQENDNEDRRRPNWFEFLAATLSTGFATRLSKKYSLYFQNRIFSEFQMQVLTLIRVVVPSLLAGRFAVWIFPRISPWWDLATAEVLTSVVSESYVPNFLAVIGLVFSILVGQTYSFMYVQREKVFHALFEEVTEAKSLLEQVALVCQGRTTMYPKVLNCIKSYVQTDLKNVGADPAELLSARPMDDPLETIMYLTSVGVPSSVYETVRTLRQVRAQRLGALQRKLPTIHMALLWSLAILQLISFPLLGPFVTSRNTVQGYMFGIMTTGIFLTMRVSRKEEMCVPFGTSNVLVCVWLRTHSLPPPKKKNLICAFLY